MTLWRFVSIQWFSANWWSKFDETKAWKSHFLWPFFKSPWDVLSLMSNKNLISQLLLLFCCKSSLSLKKKAFGNWLFSQNESKKRSNSQESSIMQVKKKNQKNLWWENESEFQGLMWNPPPPSIYKCYSRNWSLTRKRSGWQISIDSICLAFCVSV